MHDKYGYRRLAVLVGGMSAWEAAGYAVVKASPKPRDVAVSGKTLYAQHCATCHQLDGLGVEGHYPPLAGNGVTTMSDPRALVLVTLNGLKPLPTASGAPMPAEMPAFAAQLSDAEVASILSYVRSNWGNRAGAVKADEVKAMRPKP